MERTINREQLVEAVKSIPIVADVDNWVLTLDKEEGSLFYAPKRIPDGSTLHQVTDEYAIYLDKELNPAGVVVEYYRGNFLKHHDFFSEATEKVFGDLESDEEVITINPKHDEREVSIFKALLESTLIKSAGNSFVAA